MTHGRLRMLVTIALAASGAGGTLAAQPGNAPAGEIRMPAERFASHPYKTALGALANYGSCGVRARAAVYRALTAEFRAIEALAEAKGLGPTLERLRQEFRELLAVSSIMACARGPAAARAGARRAIAAFRTWVANQPAG